MEVATLVHLQGCLGLLTYPFDHTSVIATLRKRFSLRAPLTKRDEVAPELESVLNLEQPSNLGPETLVRVTHRGLRAEKLTPVSIQLVAPLPQPADAAIRPSKSVDRLYGGGALAPHLPKVRSLSHQITELPATAVTPRIAHP
jgi:hypothetical protein